MIPRFRLFSGLLVFALAAPVFAQEPPTESAKEFAKNVILDQKKIWTSPFRMTWMISFFYLLSQGRQASNNP